MIEITKPVRAIILFGPYTPMSGIRPGEFFQAVIDPNMVSPDGRFIRFDQRFQKNSEIHGWQSLEHITICEILGEEPPYESPPEGYTTDSRPLQMMGIDNERDPT